MRIGQAVQDYLQHLAGEQRSPHTVNAYRRDLTAFIAFARRRRVTAVTAVTPQLLQAFIADRCVTHDANGQRRAPASINRYRVALKALFAYLEHRWLVPRNPTAILRCQRHHALPPVVLSETEIEQVLTFPFAGRNAERDRALIAFMLLTGCRLAETVALNVGDLDLRRKVALIRQAKGGDPERVVLSDRVVAALHPVVTRTHDDPLFRAGSRRLSSRQVQRLVAQRLQEAGIDRTLTPHALRHTFATRLYNRTGDIRLVQQALRHHHVTTSETYCQVDPLRWRAAINAGPMCRA